ncbi:hypothetical protein V3C99_016041 [Haemonchus contortus]
MDVISVKLTTGDVHRRFKIRGSDMNELFNDLTVNLTQISQVGGEFDVAWQDEDGDNIVITRPVELGEAIEARKDATLRLHSVDKKVVKVESKPDSNIPQQTTEQNTAASGASNEVVHKDVLCDVCDAVIIGTRFRCLLCLDYDLCQNCEKTGVHAHHGMIRIVDPLRTFVPWGARLKYMPLGRHGRHRHGPGIGAVFPDANTRQRVHLAKEHITEQVARSMQYLQDMGQAVTAALANFGIDASYEVRGDDKKEPTADDKSKAASEEQSQPSDEQPNPENVETVPNDTLPSAPTALPVAPKFDHLEKAETEYCQAAEEAKEVNDIKEDKHEQVENVQHQPAKAPCEKFRQLEEAEMEYSKAVKASEEAKESSEAKETNLTNEAIGLEKECRCFVSRVGRWKCPACCKKERSLKRPGHKQSYSKAVSEAMANSRKESSPSKLQDSDKSSSESSDDDFETLSHESFQECSGKVSSDTKVRKSSLKTDTVNRGETSNADQETSILYPTLSSAPNADTDENDGVEDQGIAFRLIEMGFSAEEVFRVVRMHGNNFEKCIEEILLK